MFTLSAVIASSLDWAWFESGWKRQIAAKNKALRKEGRPQISRFHASDLSNLKGEFEGWTADEQIAFMQGLIGVFRKSKHMVISAYSLPFDVFVDEFPEWKRKVLPYSYSILLKFLMFETAAQYEKAKAKGGVRPIQIALIHDRSSYDAVLLRAFNQMLGDQGFRGREYFSSIAPLAWEECIPLQAADLLAYENMKDADRRATGSTRQQRKSLAALLDLPSLGGRTRRFDASSLHKFRLSLERGKQAKP
jgi:hypothetical protein